LAKFHRTAQQYVLHTLRAEILKGQYPANTHLRQEEVAKRLNVSTTPVREAFRDLRAEGLVSIDPNKGVLTRGLTAEDATQIYELRMIMEPMLAHRACPHVSPEALDAAQDCHDQMVATQSPEEWSLLNESFHDHFVIGQRDTRLFEMVGALARAARPYVNLSMYVDQGLMASNNDEHAALLAAYQAQDLDEVYRQTRQHLENTRDVVVQYVEHWQHAATLD